MEFIPYGRQSISEEDIRAVAEALRLDFLTTGPAVEAFESKLARALGAKHVVAVSSGTAALHVAMLASGAGPGDRVLISPITFLASANAAAYIGATPDFADIDPRSRNLSPEALEDQWTADVRAIVAVDFAGQSCNMPRIAEFARARGALVIEDGCHGIGGGFRFQGREYKIGGHPWADMTTFSFHPVKTITTGEGGAIATGDDALAAKCRLYRNHGMTRTFGNFTGLGTGAPPQTEREALGYYEMHAPGFNYRLADIQCALGSSQLDRLDAFVARRRALVEKYNAAFADLAYLTTPGVSDFIEDRSLISWHLYAVELDFQALGASRTEVIDVLSREGIGTQVHYIPVYLQPWYRQSFGYRPGKCPAAEAYYARCLTLPLFPAMTDSDADRVIAAVRSLPASIFRDAT